MSMFIFIFLKYFVNYISFSVSVCYYSINEGGIDMNFGTRLRECRKAKNLRQVDLAKQLGVSGQVISNLERGYTTGFSPEMLKKIANVLDTNVEYLTGNEHSESQSQKLIENDISKTLNLLMNQIRSNNAEALNYDGVELTENDLELLEDAINIALHRIIKRKKK